MFEEEFKLIALNQEENLIVASSIITNLDFIEHYKDYLNWGILSSREDLINNPEFCDRFKDKIDWVDQIIYGTTYSIPWDIFWRYRDYSIIPNYSFSIIERYVKLVNTCEEKYKILEDILRDSTKYDKEVTSCLKFPEDIDFIRKHEDRIIWDSLSITITLIKENFDLFLEFKDKICWSQTEDMEYWVINNEILLWVWDNVRDKVDWDNVFKTVSTRIPISSLKMIKSAIKEFTWTEFCYKEYYLEYSLKYLKEGITRPEHFDWSMIGKFIVNAYRYNIEDYKQIVDLPFIEKYQDYIPWENLISSHNYYKDTIIRKIIPKKTRKKLGYHIWFGIIFKLEKRESTKP